MHDDSTIMMANARHMLAMMILLFLLLCVGASAGLESVAVAPKAATCCSTRESLLENGASSPNLNAILDFIQENRSLDDNFHVQGWRWHTLSLARDARRLGSLATKLMQNATIDVGDKSLEKAVYHVIEFNMNALHRIENKTFFPWLKTQLASVEDADLAQAFALVVDDVIDKQRLVAEAGSNVVCLYVVC